MAERVFDWSNVEFPKHYNLANPAHCAWLASLLGEKDDSIGLSAADIELVAQALDACAFHAYPPPRELVDLLGRLVGSRAEGRSRQGIKDRALFDAAARAKAETGKSGRDLARHLQENGYPQARPRTIHSWERVGNWGVPRKVSNGTVDETRPPKGLMLRLQTVADFEHLVRRYRGDEADD